MYGVYAIYAPSGSAYVGMTTIGFEVRWKQHMKMLNSGRHHCVGLQRSFVKYGSNSFRMVPLVSFTKKIPVADLMALEVFWWNELFGSGILLYNARPSGNGSVNHSAETKTKIRKSILARASQVESVNRKTYEDNKESIVRNLKSMTREEVATKYGLSNRFLNRALHEDAVEVERINYRPLELDGISFLRKLALDETVSMRDASEILGRSRQWISTNCKKLSIVWVAPSSSNKRKK